MLKKFLISLCLVFSVCGSPIYASELPNGIDSKEVKYQEYEISWESVNETIYEESENQNGRSGYNWTVKADSLVQSSLFYASTGQHIRVTANISPQNQNVNVGIIEPDGTLRYVLISNYVDHTFSLDQTGMYRFFVRNRGTESISVAGQYLAY